MNSLLFVLINIIGTWLNYGKTQASGYAVASLIASVWSYGIFSNYRRDPMNIPGFWVLVSIISAISGLVFIIIGLAN